MTRLSFDRMGLWFLTEEPGVAEGSFGTDEVGNTRDERGSRVTTDVRADMGTDLPGGKPYLLRDGARLFDEAGNPVGEGQRLVAPLWGGDRILGFVSADSLLTGRPLTEEDGELLALFAATVGHLWARLRTEEALRRSEADFRALADAMPQLVWTARPDGTPDYYNSRASEYDGISQQLDGTWAWRPVVHPEDMERTATAWREAVEYGTPYECEHRIRMEDSTFRWHLSRGVRHGDRWFGTATDVNSLKAAQKATQESERRLALALEAGKQGLWDWHIPSGRVFFSDGWYMMLGYAPGELEPHVRSWEALVYPGERDRVMRALSDHLEGQTPYYECEHRLRHKDGSWRWILDRGQVVERDGEEKPLRAVGTHQDVTERREAEEALEAANLQLRRAMRETHHRIKNNLQVISAMAEIQTEGDSPVPAVAMRRVGQHARVLAALHDLLTREAKDREELEDVSAAMALDRLVPLLRAAAGGRRLTCACDDFPLPVREAGGLTLLVSELVSNALKHGAGDVTVSLTYPERLPVGEERREFRRARLEVSDQGPGFPEGFDPLKAANTGLDLILILARHDLRGEIEFARVPDGGGRVTVTFPLEGDAPY